MISENIFDAIIIGGSYSGLAAGMALGRALKKVLIIDDGKPCNRQAPQSHNFITHDGSTPASIAMLARKQVQAYSTIEFFNGLATNGWKTKKGFAVQVASGETFGASKLIFATGIKDMLPAIDGLAACWGITVLHCPYCHGYEIRNAKTAIIANGEIGYDFARLISNWTKDLALFTNGISLLTTGQSGKLAKHGIAIVEKEIEKLEHTNGHLKKIIFKDGTGFPMQAAYALSPFQQHCTIPQSLGCQLTDEGYIKIDSSQETTVKGVFACGDNAAGMRTVANAVAMGTGVGMVVSKKMIFER